MKSTLLVSAIALISSPVVTGYAFVSSANQNTFQTKNKSYQHIKSISRTSSTSLQMVDQQVLMGAGVAIAGLVAGIGMVAFTETQVCVFNGYYVLLNKIYT